MTTVIPGERISAAEARKGRGHTVQWTTLGRKKPSAQMTVPEVAKLADRSRLEMAETVRIDVADMPAAPRLPG